MVTAIKISQSLAPAFINTEGRLGKPLTTLTSKLSEILLSGNKYAYKELFRDTLKHKKKILPFLDQSLEFRKKFLKLTKKKRTDKTIKEIEKLLSPQLSTNFTTFSPINFRFKSTEHIQKYKKFI